MNTYTITHIKGDAGLEEFHDIEHTEAKSPSDALRDVRGGDWYNWPIRDTEPGVAIAENPETTGNRRCSDYYEAMDIRVGTDEESEI